MSFDFKKEEDVQAYLKNISVEYSFGCYSEKNAEACHLLADYYEAVKKEFSKASKLYKHSCDEFNFSRSCHSYASHTLTGKGLPKADPVEAQQYFTKGCELENADSCCNAGVMNISNFAKQTDGPNYEKGIAMLDKGCRLGSANACYYLSGFFISGSTDGKVSKDMTRAFNYAKKGCDLNNVYSCSNLSLMYKKGDGVEKNEALSEEIKKKAVDLQNQHNEQLSLNFQRGLDP